MTNPGTIGPRLLFVAYETWRVKRAAQIASQITGVKKRLVLKKTGVETIGVVISQYPETLTSPEQETR
jgi:hypothetical protein